MAESHSNGQRTFWDDRQERKCAKCHKVKPTTEFYLCYSKRKNRRELHAYCKECNVLICRERGRQRIASGVATLEYKKRYKKKRWEKLLKQYGVTKEIYEGMEAAQNGRCAICGKPETATYKGVLCRLGVDHDHVTGKVRGLLCHHCNLGIAHFKDNVDALAKAIHYLDFHKSLA